MSGGLKNKNIVNVGVIFNSSYDWMGGVNYFKNLFQVISYLENKKIQFYLFAGRIADRNIIKLYRPFVKIVRSFYFDNPGCFWGNLWRLIFPLNYFDNLLWKHDISVISHSPIDKSLSADLKIIGWISDFQHLHLSEMFSKKEIGKRNKDYMEIIKKSDVVIVSSRAVYSDIKFFAPKYIDKIRILPFVAIPNIDNFDEIYTYKLMRKYKIPDKYFLLPGQFWKHKNHSVVVEAVKKLKNRKIEICIVCTGYTEDTRDRNYFVNIKEKILKYKLSENIKILGLIEDRDLSYLLKYSLAMINPSLFEGWSTVVEEAKSIEKRIILSDIPVHREQNPSNAIYFNPNDSLILTEILYNLWQKDTYQSNFDLEKKAKKLLEKRIMQFAEKYQKIVLEVCK